MIMMALKHPQVMRVRPCLIAVCLLGRPAQAKYSGGNGTAQDPYQIATAADLMALGETPVDGDGHFILTTDIDPEPNFLAGRSSMALSPPSLFAPHQPGAATCIGSGLDRYRQKD